MSNEHIYSNEIDGDDYCEGTQMGDPHRFEQHFCIPEQSLSTSQKWASQRNQLGSLDSDEDNGHVPFFRWLSLGIMQW